jgi:predicted ester cyclase
MSSEEIKARGRRITEELINQGDLSVVDELIDPDYTEYVVAQRQTVSAAGMKEFITVVRRAFPDLHAHTEQQIVEGDTLVQRLTMTGTHQGQPFHGLSATGRRIRFGVVDISRMGANGKFVQRWTLADQLALLSQLSLLPDGAMAIGRPS